MIHYKTSKPVKFECDLFYGFITNINLSLFYYYIPRVSTSCKNRGKVILKKSIKRVPGWGDGSVDNMLSYKYEHPSTHVNGWWA